MQELAEVKHEAEQRLYRRIDFSLRVARVVYALVAAVIFAAIWLTSLQLQVVFNTHAIQKIWSKVFEYPLP